MKRRDARRRNNRAPIVGAVVLGTALVLAVAGCWAALTPGGSTRSPVPSEAAVAAATPAGSSSGSPSPRLSAPAETSSPAGSPSPAPSYPLVNSCKPSSVPGAIPVTTPASGKDSSFALHVPVLMYHRIVPVALAGDSLRGLVVPPETFAAQLDLIAGAGWHTITMATLADDLQAHRTPPPKTFVITIDDGWDDGYTYALPILQKHGFVATYFVIAGRIDHDGFLTTAHLRALVAAGDEIGDHTMDHVDLPSQKPEQLTYEIDAAAARIAQVTGRWPESLAYPSGGVDNLVVAAVQACEEMRIAVVEEQLVTEKPGTTAKPAATPVATAQPAAVPAPGATAMPLVSETWANRFVVPRLRVSPTTIPADLLAELDRYQSD